MVQGKLATSPLPIALFSISYCQQLRIQHPVTSIHKSKFHPIHYSHKWQLLNHYLGLGVYTPVAQSTLRKMDLRKRFMQPLGHLGTKFWDPRYSKHGLEWKGSGFKWAYPTDSLPHARGTKQGPLKNRARAGITLARNRISLEPSNIIFVNLDSNNIGTHFIIICEIVHESFMYFSTNNGTDTMCLLIWYTISCSRYSCPKSMIWI